MRLDTRLSLAREAYQRAVQLARNEATPSSWRRLRAAATNLALAQHDRATGRSGRWTGVGARSTRMERDHQGGGAPGGASVIPLLPSRAGDDPGALRSAPPPPAGAAGREATPGLWVSLVAERERALRLLAHGRTLVEELRTLRKEWLALRAAIASAAAPAPASAPLSPHSGRAS